VVLLLFALGVGAFLMWRFWPSGLVSGAGLDPGAQPRRVEPRADLTQLEKTNVSIYDSASRSLVQVTNLSEDRGEFGLDVQEVPRGLGSGFVWDDQGHVVTNYHVVQGADAARVTLSDHSVYQAQQIWAYPEKDIAVLWVRVPKGKLHPIPLGTSHDLKVGQMTYALGDPFGLAGTMTTGIISALGRQITDNGNKIDGVIQTNAAINPGNSGGPLLDSAGRLIGMNTAILSPSGGFAGVGFAIPVDEINRVVPELIRHGKVVRPRLGVQLAEDQLARQFGIDQGALILKVVPGSAAEQAGLQGTRRDEEGQILLGDVIVAIDGKEVNNGKELHAAVQEHHPGDTVTLTILRDGERKDVKVTL
jgi:S1-C subfamily serine protease